MNMEKRDTFQTSDLPLATFLYAKGVLLKHIISSPNDNRRKVFVFIEPPPELISVFQSGQAEINVLAFNNAQNTLKGLIRESEGRR